MRKNAQFTVNRLDRALMLILGLNKDSYLHKKLFKIDAENLVCELFCLLNLRSPMATSDLGNPDYRFASKILVESVFSEVFLI